MPDGKAGELRAWMGTWDWDIIAITQTRLKEGQDWQLNVHFPSEVLLWDFTTVLVDVPRTGPAAETRQGP